MPLRATIIATAVLAAAPLAAGPDSAAGAPAQQAAYPACDADTYHNKGRGWYARTPGRWESPTLNCNLRLNDPAGRPPNTTVDTPGAIRTLQWTLNSCYRGHLTIDGRYGTQTRDAVKRVQRLHRLTADGVFGPQTRSAMYWRLYNFSYKVWSERCYSPF